MDRVKKYVEREGKTLRVSVYYDLGGANYFSGDTTRRGYYLSVTPVERVTSADGTVISESFTMFSGFKILLKEVPRKSKKAEDRAVEISEEKEEELILAVLKKEGLAV